MLRVRIVAMFFLLLLPPLASSQSWTELPVPGTLPSARYDSTAIYNPANNTLVMFGGNSTSCSVSTALTPSLKDTWLLSNANGVGGVPSWTSPPLTTLPGVRRNQTAVYNSTSDTMIVFGGDAVACADQKLNDVWWLNNATGVNGTPAWNRANPAGGPPIARSDHTAVYDHANNRMIIFGGYAIDQSNLQNDVWVLINADGTTGAQQWTQLHPMGVPPNAPELATAVYDPASNRMIVFGGWNCCQGPYSDQVSILTNANGLGGTPQWIQPAIASGPAARAGHKTVYDPASNRMTIFGGSGAVQYNDVWVLSGANGLSSTSQWTQLNASAPPPALGGPTAEPAAAYDPTTNRMIIFGGSTATIPATLQNGTWVLADENGLPLTITTTSLLNATLGVPYSVTLAAVNGAPPYTWSAAGLPSWLSLNSSSGTLTGISTATGSFPFTITVTDTDSTTATQTLNVSVPNPAYAAITEFSVPTPNSQPAWITPGPNHDLWFTEQATNKIAQITVANDNIQEYPVTTPNAGLLGIVTGPDGNIWFCEYGVSQVGRFIPPNSQNASGQINEWPTLTPASKPSWITTGSDGALWFTEFAARKIGRVTTGGDVTEPVNLSFSPDIIALGPDGDLWFGEGGGSGPFQGNDIGTVNSDGIPNYYPVPTPNSDAAYGLVKSADGSPSLWFTETLGNKFGRVTTSGSISEFPVIPNQPGGASSQPDGMSTATDGTLWFTEKVGNRIVHLTTDGVITEYPVPTLSSNPEMVVQGSDGAMWFVEGGPASGSNQGSGKIGRLAFVPQLVILPLTLISGAPGVPYPLAVIPVQGGAPPYTYYLLGTLPPGLTVNPTGTITGTPTTLGTYPFTVLVSDTSSPIPQRAAQSFTISITPGPLTITTMSLPPGVAGVPYPATMLQASGGTLPYTWTVTGLPSGLKSAAGVITGTPTASGPFSVGVTVTDSTPSAPQHTSTTLNLSIALPTHLQPPASAAFSSLSFSDTSATISTGQLQILPQEQNVTVSGSLSLHFTPDMTVPGLPAGGDPGLQFGAGVPDKPWELPATSTTPLSSQFTINPGSSTTPITIAPGTLAGTITISLDSLSFQQQAGAAISVPPPTPTSNTIQVPSGVCVADSVSIDQITATSFDVEIVGFSTSRAVTTASVTFTAGTGTQLTGSTTQTVSVQTALTNWYSTTQSGSYGSAFMLSIPFSYSGNQSAIQAMGTPTATLGGCSP